MTLTLNYTYRIYPDNKQEAMLSEWLEICRRSYNYALRELKDWISSRKCLVQLGESNPPDFYRNFRD